MAVSARSHLSDPALLHALSEDLATESGASAQVLVDLAEVDVRRLYAPAGYPSMFEFCVRKLRFTREKALKRIRVARAVRRFPRLLERIADGRLSLSAVVRLATHLTSENAGSLIDAASGKTIEELELLLAARFPRPDLPTQIAPVPDVPAVPRIKLAPLDAPSAATLSAPVTEPMPLSPASGQAVEAPVVPATEPSSIPVLSQVSTWTLASQPARARVAPRSAERFGIQVTVDRSTHDLLRQAQALLRREVPDGDVAAVLDRALKLLVRELEKRQFSMTDRPRARRVRTSANPRRIPAEVKRAVVARDKRQCTFVSETGQRCEATGGLEFDHIEPVSRGGRATVSNLRLRCRAHNQYEAERTLGAEFMRHKRIAAREATARRKSGKQTRAEAIAGARDAPEGPRFVGASETRVCASP